jgi:hypothetical protein
MCTILGLLPLAAQLNPPANWNLELTSETMNPIHIPQHSMDPYGTIVVNVPT